MKIEKINENQIRCTLTKEDLEIHQIKLSELAYGTEKAKQLFRDMMQQAHTQFGFEADNIPLMIEAIPVSAESIILIITKVEDPEELDTRFSKFSPYKNRGQEQIHVDGADNIIDLIQKLCDAKSKNSTPKVEKGKEEKPSTPAASPKAAAEKEPAINLVRLYSFSQLEDVVDAAHSLSGFFLGENSLYKDNRRCCYKLVIHQSDYTPEEFNKVCNILSEYGRGEAFTASGEAYLGEHTELLLPYAIQSLEKI